MVFCLGKLLKLPQLLIASDLSLPQSYDTGTISGILAMPYWQELFSTGHRDATGNLNITSSQSSAIVSILSAGTFFGALGAAPLGDSIGRRWGLIASSWVFIFGVILQTVATAIPLFLAGRFFAGFGVGLVSALSMFTPSLVLTFTDWYYHYSSSIPVRDRTKVDSWIYCRLLPAGHYHWSTFGFRGQQFDSQPE